LAIIGLATGSQPLANEDETVWVTFNGEIYNYRDLRADLQKRGHQFRTNSDTEVLVHGYEEWGEGLPARLDGMFAFGIWDERKRGLFLCRDRFGIKPLYIWRRGDRVAFASDVRAFAAHPDFSRHARLQAVAEYLSYGYVPGPSTIYSDVTKLEPGTWVRIGHDQTTREGTYWSLRTDLDSNGPATSVEALPEVLRDAVSSHLVSDVPVGLFLSGGIDSTLLALLMKEMAPEPSNTFTIGFEGHPRCERDAARLVATDFACIHHERDASVLNTEALLDQLADVYSEPLADTSAIPTLELSRFASQTVKVVLGGDGGDEMFAGYPNIFRPFVGRKLGLINAVRRIAGRSVSAGRAELLAYHRNRYALLSCAAVATAMRSHGLTFTEAEQVQALGKHYDRGESLVRRLQKVELATFLRDMILVKVDRASMKHSLEVRVPLLDHKLARFAFALPESALVRGPADKRLIRNFLAGRVPEQILQKSKSGFGYPLERDFNFDIAKDLVMNGVLRRSKLFSPTWIEGVWNGSGYRLNNVRYQLAILEMWTRRWCPADFRA